MRENTDDEPFWKKCGSESFKTGISFIDKMCGLPINEVTEVCGLAGVGKTLFLHQIAVSFVNSVPNGHVLFFDIDRSFNPYRLLAICKRLNLTCDGILDRILVYYYTDIDFIIKTINDRITNASLKYMIILDSIPNLFASELLYEDEEKWSDEYLKLIVKFGNFLRSISETCTVVISNQVRTLLPGKKLDNIDSLWLEEGVIPALGSIWEEFIDNRIYIKKIRRDTCVFIIVFSSVYPETFGLVKFFGDYFE